MAHETELQIFELVRLHLHLMERIASAIETLASVQVPQQAPNYLLPLERWRDFDWSSIKATIMHAGSDGPTILSWGGHHYIRRSPINKFKPAIWFSRSIGKDGKGELIYERLITFEPLPQAEPVPERLSRLVR